MPEKEIDHGQALGDVFDVFNMVSEVHSKMPEMNRDFTLANYGNSKVIDEKLPRFIREQMAVTRIVGDYLLLSMDKLKKHYPNRSEEELIRLLGELDRVVKMTQATLLQEINMLTIMSRNPNGEILAGALQLGLTPTIVTGKLT